MSILQRIKNGFKQVIFPNVCVCCKKENTENERQICSFCLNDRFEDGNPANKMVSSDSLLPDGILAQHALWKFDKGGDLQNLLHQLKYERLTTIGIDLGRKLGQRLKTHPAINSYLEANDSIIIPVPLHYLKYRFRGFNQAFFLAKGFQEVWDNIPICEIDDVVRVKNTSSQTGFSLEKRLENMQKAFKVNSNVSIANKLCVIVDDVFTTGATTFELSATLTDAGADSIIIATVAQA